MSLRRIALFAPVAAVLLAACTEKLEVPQTPPDFDASARFIPVDEVYAALQDGEGFYFLDARPKVDYALSHIEGAISVPFYEVADHTDPLPKKAWYIAYCSCPHSESGVVVDHLLDNGYANVGILDEGYLVWAERGYPVWGESPYIDSGAE